MSKLFTIILSLFFSTILYAENTISITNGEWEPYMSQYSYHYGVNSHVISEALKLEGIKVKWGFFTWKSAYILAKEGKKWHASATWWPTEETKKAFFISKAISKTSFVYFHLKKYKFNWNSIDDLKGYRIGGTFGYDYGKEFMTAMKEKKINVEFVTRDELNYKKLLLNRIHIFPNDRLVGYSQIKNSLSFGKAKLLTHHTKEFEISTLHLIISKKAKNSKFFLKKFDSGFEKLKKSGRFAKMFKELDAGKYNKQKAKWE